MGQIARDVDMGVSAMSVRARLLFGPVAAFLFVLSVAGLGALLPGYIHVRQTISEIGAMGGPLRTPFAVMACLIATSLLLFASAVRAVSVRAGRSAWPAYLIAYVALTEVGLAIFATPHPIHNMIGPTALLGFQAPGLFALIWRREQSVRGLVAASWILFTLLWAAAAANLLPILHSPAAAMIEPVMGLAQRALFGSWFAWCAAAGWLLSRSPWAQIPEPFP